MIVVFSEIRNERDTGDPSSILGETKVSTDEQVYELVDVKHYQIFHSTTAF